MRQLPDAWRTLAERRGITPSARGIALVAGVAPSTVTRLVFDGITSPGTVRVVADVLGVSTREVTDIAGLRTSQLGPWDPPTESHRLSARQRDAIDRLILAIVEEGDETNGLPAAQEKMPPDADPAFEDDDESNDPPAGEVHTAAEVIRSLPVVERAKAMRLLAVDEDVPFAAYLDEHGRSAYHKGEQ